MTDRIPQIGIAPISLRDANAFVSQVHRHHKPTQGGKFAISAVREDGSVVGVVIVGRPVSRTLDDGLTAEVTRLATDGTRNCCSMLYGAAWRAARGMGYRKCITYILNDEPGTSLKASGWRCIGEAGGGTWNRPNRKRTDKHPVQKKLRYEVSDE